MFKKVRNTFQIAFSFDIIFVLSAQEASIELSELKYKGFKKMLQLINFLRTVFQFVQMSMTIIN